MGNEYLNYYEIITVFTIGVMFLTIISVLLKLKLKTIMILAANSLIGTFLYVLLTVNFAEFSPLDIVNVFICGISGIIGTLLVILIIKIL